MTASQPAGVRAPANTPLRPRIGPPRLILAVEGAEATEAKRPGHGQPTPAKSGRPGRVLPNTAQQQGGRPRLDPDRIRAHRLWYWGLRGEHSSVLLPTQPPAPRRHGPGKSVAFELLLDEGSKTRARIPLRVKVNPHDTTESIISTVKNFYGIYDGNGVSFEDAKGDTLIASFDNLAHGDIVYVRSVAGPPPLPSQAALAQYGRSASPPQLRGRRSASQQKAASAYPGASRGSSASGSYHENDGFSDSDAGRSSLSGSRKAKSEQIVSSDISTANTLPLFVPPQVPVSASQSSISPQRRSLPQEGPSPFRLPAQKLYGLQQQAPVLSPLSHGRLAHDGSGEQTASQSLATPAPHSHHLRDRNGIHTAGAYRGRAAYAGQAVLPTPDPTVASCISDEDVARTLIALGDASNYSHGRTSTSTMDDTFSGVADAASSTGATSDSDEYSDEEGGGRPRHRKFLDQADQEYGAEAAAAALKHECDDVQGPKTKKIKTKMYDGPGGMHRAAKPGAGNVKAMKPLKTRPDSHSLPKAAKALSQQLGLTKAAAHAAGHAAPLLRKASTSTSTTASSSLNFQHQLAADEEDLSTKPRCQRCRKSKKGCDRQRPCQRCKDAGIGIEGCISEDEGNGRKGRFGRHMGVPVKKAMERDKRANEMSVQVAVTAYDDVILASTAATRLTDEADKADKPRAVAMGGNTASNSGGCNNFDPIYRLMEKQSKQYVEEAFDLHTPLACSFFALAAAVVTFVCALRCRGPARRVVARRVVVLRLVALPSDGPLIAPRSSLISSRSGRTTTINQPEAGCIMADQPPPRSSRALKPRAGVQRRTKAERDAFAAEQADREAKRAQEAASAATRAAKALRRQPGRREDGPAAQNDSKATTNQGDAAGVFGAAAAGRPATRRALGAGSVEVVLDNGTNGPLPVSSGAQNLRPGSTYVAEPGAEGSAPLKVLDDAVEVDNEPEQPTRHKADRKPGPGLAAPKQPATEPVELDDKDTEEVEAIKEQPSSPDVKRKTAKKPAGKPREVKLAPETAEERTERLRVADDVDLLRHVFSPATADGASKYEPGHGKLPPTAADIKSKGPTTAKKDGDAGPKHATMQDGQHDSSNVLTACSPRDQLPSGLVGKLNVHASGKITLDWAGADMEVRLGTSVGFLQDAVLLHTARADHSHGRTAVSSSEATPIVDPDPDREHQRDGTPESKAFALGQLDARLVVVPDWNKLYD
ncbi:hypothetical protein DV737_g552, partial [Chaetothyriales sp. CBS 132003]